MTDSSFVFGWVLDGQGGGTPITDPAAPAQPQQWLHFDYSHPSILKTLDELGLPNRVIESLTRVDTRPRTAILEDGILVLLRGVNMNPGADPEDMVSLHHARVPDHGSSAPAVCCSGSRWPDRERRRAEKHPRPRYSHHRAPG
jgi:hypothetical protein